MKILTLRLHDDILGRALRLSEDELRRRRMLRVLRMLYCPGSEIPGSLGRGGAVRLRSGGGGLQRHLGVRASGTLDQRAARI